MAVEDAKHYRVIHTGGPLPVHTRVTRLHDSLSV